MNVCRTKSYGFTLIELMIATTLGLMLLGGLVKIVAMVNTSFADTRVLIDLQNQCRSTQTMLQNDLGNISVTPQPPRATQADDGYLSLGTMSSSYTEGDDSKTKRGDVKLVDFSRLSDNNCNYIAFTVFSRDYPFIMNDPEDSSRIIQTPYAEIVWFVYKYDLYRVVVPFVNAPGKEQNYYSTNSNIPNIRMITPALLGVPSKRIMSKISSLSDSQRQQFLVMPNVFCFRVQVYDYSQQKYIDVSSIGSSSYFGKATASGNYETKTIGIFTACYDTGSVISSGTNTNIEEENGVYVNPDVYKKDLVPTTAFLPGLRIIIRAFDPDSGTIRQFRVGQDFRTR